MVDRFTDGRVPDCGIRALWAQDHRWQRWLDVESVLASAEADAGLVPHAAADAITSAAQIDQLDLIAVRNGIAATSHPLMALVSELSRVVGDPHGGWVHWGATTQNIIQTGDALVLREVHQVLLRLISDQLGAMADLAVRGADMVEPGRTHGQQAVPITFGFKVAGWIDETGRHVARLREVEKRVFTAMMGGAVGNFASFGSVGPAVQAGIALRLGLISMPIPSRALADSLAEYVCILGLIAASGSRIATEIYTLMKTEFGEVDEPAPAGTIGSSTMPHKRNPQLADDCLTISARIRVLVPLALEGMIHDHEVDGAHSAMTDEAVRGATELAGDLLSRLVVILAGLDLHPARMRSNADLTGGLIASEQVMLALGKAIGRQHAHELVYEIAQAAVADSTSFADLLAADTRVSSHLSQAEIAELLDPATATGLSADLARQAAESARMLARDLATGAR